MTTHSPRPSVAGYTLVEATIAIGIMLGGIAAAAALALNTAQMEDINYRKGRVLAIAEGAARMWQLGLSPAATGTLLLGDPALVSLSFNGDPGDPPTVVPTDGHAPIADPSSDLGVFEQATVRAVARTREAAGMSGPPEVVFPLEPIIVIR